MGGLLSEPYAVRGECGHLKNIHSHHNLLNLQSGNGRTHARTPWCPCLWRRLGESRFPLHWESKNLLQFLSIWWGDRESAYGHFHQGQTHTPNIRLNRVVSPLQTLRLHNTTGNRLSVTCSKTNMHKQDKFLEGGYDVCFSTHRHVRPRAHKGVGHGVDELSAHSEIAQLDLTARVHQNV